MSQDSKMIVNYSHPGLVKRAELSNRVEEAVELAKIVKPFQENLHPRGPGGIFKTKPKPPVSPTKTGVVAPDRAAINGLMSVTGSQGFMDIVIGLATGAINESLSFPIDLPGLSVVEGSIDTPGMLGGFYPSLKKIAISAAEDWKASTLIHEIGHFLDHNIMKDGTLLSRNPDFLSAVTRSKKIQQVGNDYRKGVDEGFNGYLLNPKEVFARAFAQYVITKSSNKTLKAEIKADPTQWTDKDFAPIAKQMDTMFKGLRMRK